MSLGWIILEMFLQTVFQGRQRVQQADVAVVFVGEESILSGEAYCPAGLRLQGVQSELASSHRETGTPCMYCDHGRTSLIFSESYALSDAVLYAWHPGTMGGPAIAELLGREVLSGKLPVTFLVRSVRFRSIIIIIIPVVPPQEMKRYLMIFLSVPAIFIGEPPII